jgi:excisionase family DNA binding protein
MGNASMAEEQTKTDEIFTIGECATYLKVSSRTIERLLAEGEAPPSSKVGRRVIFLRSDVNRWLEQRVRRPVRNQT